jgi:hypothetical protein
MVQPRTIRLTQAQPVSHDEGVVDREADVDGTRWAFVEYSPGALFLIDALPAG